MGGNALEDIISQSEEFSDAQQDFEMQRSSLVPPEPQPLFRPRVRSTRHPDFQDARGSSQKKDN